MLVDRLLALPFEEVAVLDLSEVALGKAKVRLGERGDRVRWGAVDLAGGQALAERGARPG